jgi:hypothetical protein
MEGTAAESTISHSSENAVTRLLNSDIGKAYNDQDLLIIAASGIDFDGDKHGIEA